MTELLTAAQMRAIEQAAIDSGEVTGLELMERAGVGVVEAILEEWPEMALTTQKAVVLCGPGNNGGDGFVVARLLKQRGWEVEVFLYGEVEKLPPDAKVNCERWLELGAVEDFYVLLDKHEWQSETNLTFRGQEVLFFDAVFGTGLIRPLEQVLAEFLFDAREHSLGKVISLDVPSGQCADSGEILDDGEESSLKCVKSVDLNVTFHRAKIGSKLETGASAIDAFRIVDIGLDRYQKKYTASAMMQRAMATQKGEFPLPELVKWVGKLDSFDTKSNPSMEHLIMRPNWPHKYSHGHALILSGPAHFTGAGRLAARGALRVGAGLVTLGCEAAAMAENAAQLTSIMLAEVADAGALTERLQDKRINALCLGPGLGLDERARGLVEAALAVRAEHAPYRLGVVLDADAITLLAQNSGLFGMLHDKVVLTPHAGEFKRLFPDIAAKLDAPAASGPAYSKVDATREAAKRAGCTVLFKGADTVIADQTGRAAINSAHYERAAPWLATAGSGDVLAGFITGLLARGFAPMQAAETAAWLHVECALEFGPGLIAEDIPEQLPAVFRKLGL